MLLPRGTHEPLSDDVCTRGGFVLIQCRCKSTLLKTRCYLKPLSCLPISKFQDPLDRNAILMRTVLTIVVGKFKIFVLSVGIKKQLLNYGNSALNFNAMLPF